MNDTFIIGRPYNDEELLEIIREYKEVFEQVGINEEKAFELLQGKLMDGVLGTDKISDCIKGIK